MQPPRDVIPATLSFLLPGLGQVYQRRPGRGISIFLAFTLLNSLPTTRPFLVVPVVVGSWDAYRGTPATGEAPDAAGSEGRRYWFLAAGFAAFVGWMSLFAMTIFLR